MSRNGATRTRRRSSDTPFEAMLRGVRAFFPNEHTDRLVPVPPEDAFERAYARCPSCQLEGCLTLEIIEPERGEDVLLDCLTGCTENEIRAALVLQLGISAIGPPSDDGASAINGRQP